MVAPGRRVCAVWHQQHWHAANPTRPAPRRERERPRGAPASYAVYVLNCVLYTLHCTELYCTVLHCTVLYCVQNVTILCALDARRHCAACWRRAGPTRHGPAGRTRRGPRKVQGSGRAYSLTPMSALSIDDDALQSRHGFGEERERARARCYAICCIDEIGWPRRPVIL